MGEGRKRESQSPPRRAHTPFRHPSPCIVRAGPRPQPSRAPRRPRPPSHKRAAPAEAVTQSPGSQPLRSQSTGKGSKRGPTYGAAAAALPQPGTPTVGHTAASLRRPPLLRPRWRQYLLSPPTTLPPTPPPPSPPPPPPNHRSTEGETQRLTTTWLPPPPPLPSPRPPGPRNALREKGEEGGALTEVRLLSVACSASPALPAPAGGSSARAHAL